MYIDSFIVAGSAGAVLTWVKRSSGRRSGIFIARGAIVIKKIAVLSALAFLAACAQPAATQQEVSASAERGRLLYENACGACHTTQPHWREKHLVQSWDDLLYQVNRWQGVSGQNWRGADVRDAAAYLNERFYHLPCRDAGCAGPQALSAPGSR